MTKSLRCSIPQHYVSNSVSYLPVCTWEFLPVHVLPSLTPWFHFLLLLFQVLVKLISSQVNVPLIVKLYTGMLSLIYNDPISSDIKARVGKESEINWWLKAVCLFKTQDHRLVFCFSSFSLCWSVHYPDMCSVKSKVRCSYDGHYVSTFLFLFTKWLMTACSIPSWTYCVWSLFALCLMQFYNVLNQYWLSNLAKNGWAIFLIAIK